MTAAANLIEGDLFLFYSFYGIVVSTKQLSYDDDKELLDISTTILVIYWLDEARTEEFRIDSDEDYRFYLSAS